MFSRAILQLTDALEGLKVPYFVGGSIASSTHGIARSTLDVDVVARLTADGVAPLIERLGPDFEVDDQALQEAVRRRSSTNFYFLPEFTRIDLYVPHDSPFNDSRFARRVFFGEPGRRVALSSVEDTILKKLEWYRKGHEASASRAAQRLIRTT